MKQANYSSRFFTAWHKLPLVIRAIITGCLVSTVGIAAWSILFILIPAPWSIFPMAIVLWVYVKLFGGRGILKKGREYRRLSFRAVSLDASVWKWGMLGAVTFVIIVQASFVITFRLTDFPADRFTSDYRILDRMPVGVAWIVLIAGSIVAGICEETGFRGYMQVPLEKKYGPVIAVVVTSVIFTLIHLSHSWAAPILPQIFFASVLLGILAYKTGSIIPGIIGHSILDVFDYSVWWSDITGGFNKQTIFKTGVDLHFIVWILVFTLALFVFFRSVAQINKSSQRHSMTPDPLRLYFK
jgi:membrane protease YdiL (CAAX protease family)